MVYLWPGYDSRVEESLKKKKKMGQKKGCLLREKKATEKKKTCKKKICLLCVNRIIPAIHFQEKKGV